jgi:hypothetical protein
MRLETPQLANMGRPGLVEGTRELLEDRDIVVYKVKNGMKSLSCQWCTARRTGSGAGDEVIVLSQSNVHRESTCSGIAFTPAETRTETSPLRPPPRRAAPR